MTSRDDYEGLRIEILSSLDAVRRRPHMYLGDDPDLYADRLVALVVMDHQRAVHVGRLAVTVTIMSEWHFSCADTGLGRPPFVTSGRQEFDPLQELSVGGPHQGLLLARAFAETLTVTSVHQGRRWQRAYEESSLEPAPAIDLGPTGESGSTTDVLLASSRLTRGLSRSLSLGALDELFEILAGWRIDAGEPVAPPDVTVVDQR